ncbi:uncharacterized protein ACO6RY_01214 [Pungitius sinensis]
MVDGVTSRTGAFLHYVRERRREREREKLRTRQQRTKEARRASFVVASSPASRRRAAPERTRPGFNKRRGRRAEEQL